jgi:hypothetical protein
MPLEVWIAIGASLFVTIFVPLMSASSKKGNHDHQDKG